MKNILSMCCAFASFSLVLIFPLVAMAQGTPVEPSDVPIDGGLSLLLAAGIGYGAKKAYDARKKQKINEEK